MTGNKIINFKNLLHMKTPEFTKQEDGTYVFPQVSKQAAQSKFRRMLSGAGFFGMKHFTIGFANWNLNLDSNTIECHTTYHSKSTILDMYTKNCKGW